MVAMTLKLHVVIRAHILAALNENDYNIMQTAIDLGVSRRAFYRLIAKHGIRNSRLRKAPMHHARLVARAGAEVARAIKNGLQRGPCEVCGETMFIEAHHDDYHKPLQIRWLCREHHARLEGAKRKGSYGRVE
jgi:hypothetical protein